MNERQLLEAVSKIKLKNDELIKLRGENFNIFSILGLDRKEVPFHSRMIVELLSPNGSHEMGATFLELFIHHLFKKEIIKNEFYFLNKKANVKKEVFIDNINPAKTIGGSIDILIYTDSFYIAIENKIDASDQDGQLIRYYNYIKEKQFFLLLYLTPKGTEPSEHSISNENHGIKLKSPDHYSTISYQEDIINWLQACHEKCSDKPVIRETIKQYIITLKKMTNQLTSQEMKVEIINLISENYQSVKFLVDNFGTAKRELQKQLWSLIEEKLRNQISATEWRFKQNEDIFKTWSNLEFRKEHWAEDLLIYFEGVNSLSEGFLAGVIAKKRSFNKNAINEYFLNKKPIKKNHDNWAWYYERYDFEPFLGGDLNKAATEVVEYIMSILKKEENNCDIINSNYIIKNI